LSLFAFNHIDNDLDFAYATTNKFTSVTETFINNMRFDDNYLTTTKDVDPEMNYFNDFSVVDSIYECASNLSISLTSNSDLSILHINCRSINKNFDNLRHLIHQIPFQIPIIAVTETWTTKLTENNFSLPGYNFIAKSRESNSYGGVGIYPSK